MGKLSLPSLRILANEAAPDFFPDFSRAQHRAAYSFSIMRREKRSEGGKRREKRKGDLVIAVGRRKLGQKNGGKGRKGGGKASLHL